jgi:Phospholipase_D-nuclease N-terminal
MKTLADALSLSGGEMAILVLVALAELALAVFCIVDIVRRPAVLGGRKWVWIVVVAVFNLIGSIVYLAAGRVQPEADDASHEQAAETEARGRAAATADLLYGPAPDAATGPAPEPPATAPPPGTGAT